MCGLEDMAQNSYEPEVCWGAGVEASLHPGWRHCLGTCRLKASRSVSQYSCSLLHLFLLPRHCQRTSLQDTIIKLGRFWGHGSGLNLLGTQKSFKIPFLTSSWNSWHHPIKNGITTRKTVFFISGRKSQQWLQWFRSSEYHRSFLGLTHHPQSASPSIGIGCIATIYSLVSDFCRWQESLDISDRKTTHFSDCIQKFLQQHL